MQCELCGSDMLMGDEHQDEDGIITREWSCPDCLHLRRQTIQPLADWEPEPPPYRDYY